MSGCGTYRIRLVLDELAKRGHDASYGGRLPADLQWSGVLDVLIGQRVCLDGPTEIWQSLARHDSTLMVYEIDDDLLDIDPSNLTAYRFYDARKRQNIIDNMTVADLVTVSTPYLGEIAARYNRNVVVLPNCVPRWLTEYEMDRSSTVTIGWGGGASHELDWAECSHELKRFVARNDVELHTIGVDYAAGWRNARHTGWIGAVEDYLKAFDYHIGLAPLRPSVFNRSKSALKALEYAALGIPCVASDFGPYPAFVRDGETGLLVKRPHEWATALRTLVNDSAAREEMGANARGMVRELCTVEANAWRWESAYENTLNERIAA